MAAAASPGSGSSTSSDWIVLRDGCLRCDEEGLRSLSYHPALNAILAVTSRGSIKVIDGTSGAILQASALHGKLRCPLSAPHTNSLNFDKPATDCQQTQNTTRNEPGLIQLTLAVPSSYLQAFLDYLVHFIYPAVLVQKHNVWT